MSWRQIKSQVETCSLEDVKRHFFHLNEKSFFKQLRSWPILLKVCALKKNCCCCESNTVKNCLLITLYSLKKGTYSHFFKSPFNQHAILPTCYFINMPFCLLFILLTYFFNIPYCLDFVNLSFCQLGI
jgi:hypothetical protein